jgi:hypothetical protein
MVTLKLVRPSPSTKAKARARSRAAGGKAKAVPQPPSAVRLGALSNLEGKTVQPATQKHYKKSYELFMEYCQEQELCTDTTAQLELAALEHLDFRYLEGDESYVAGKLLGAILFTRSELMNLPKEALGRFRRAVKGFAKACPPKSRLPLPWEWAAGIAAVMHRNGHSDSAVALVVAFDTYVRPGALMQVHLADLLRPVDARGLRRWGLQLFPQVRRQTSKTGTQDDTVIFGNFDIDLVPLLQRQMLGRKSDALLFPQGMRKYKEHFDLATLQLGLERFKLVTYQTRHGGATRDILMQRRDLEEVRKRGQWRTYSSLRRYEKSGRLQQVLQTTPARVLQYCQGMEDRLLQILLGPASSVPPPPRP